MELMSGAPSEVPRQGIRAPYSNTRELVAAVRRCSKMRDLEGGRRLHRDAVAAGFHTNSYVAAALITMYSKCRDMGLAQQVLDGMVERDAVMWNSLIMGYVQNGKSLQAMELFAAMDCQPSCFTYVAALKACKDLACESKKLEKQVWLEKGIAIHKQIEKQGFDSDIFVASSLVDMYSKFESMDQAREVFDRMCSKNVATWNSLMLGYVQTGESLVAMDLFTRMDCEPDCFTYVAALKACGALASVSESEKQLHLERGIAIHRQAKDRGFVSDKFVASCLVDMYRKCGSMDRAREIFDSMRHKDIVTWTSLIQGYVQNNDRSMALELFARMDCEPEDYTYAAAISACAGLANEVESEKYLYLEKGMVLHRQAKDRGLDSNTYVTTSLLDMYCKCGSMDRAKEVFDKMIYKDVLIWNLFILGYLENGESLAAMDLLARMDCEPDAFTYVNALKACGRLASEVESEKQLYLEKGMAVHKILKARGFDSKIFVASSLVDMYSKCGSMDRAREVFDRMVSYDVVTWTALINGYVQNGECLIALDLFESMDCEPDRFTYIAALSACGTLASETEAEKQVWLDKGIIIHKRIKDHGFDSQVFVASSLVDMYSKCGSMHHAKQVFDSMACKNVVTWTSLIQGFLQNGEAQLALSLFSCMDCEPNGFTYVAAINACKLLAAEGKLDKQSCVEKGTAIHKRAKDTGFDSEKFLGNSLVDLYSKCERLDRAKEVFDRMVAKNVVTWNSLISGYVQTGKSPQALDLFARMDGEPDCFTYIAVLKACASSASLAAGQQIHARVCRIGMEQAPLVAAVLMDFYGKSGRAIIVEELFNNVHSPCLALWNTLIAGYGQFGDSHRVFSLLKEMQETGLQMDSISFSSILTACSHTGLVEEARLYFDAMSRCGIPATMEHYNIMVDALGRANRLEEALALVNTMPFKPDVVTWISLLGGCRKWKNLEIGKIAFDSIQASAAGPTELSSACALMRELEFVTRSGGLGC